MARKITDNPDKNNDTEEEMSFDGLTITGGYRDYDILEEQKESISKNDEVWIKSKNRYGEGVYCYLLTLKKDRN